MLKRLIEVGLPRDNRFALGLFLAVLEGAFAVSLLAVSAWLISAAAEQPPLMWLNEAIVGVRGFALGRAFFRYTQRLSLHDSAFAMLSRVRPRLFAKIAPLAPAGLPHTSPAAFADAMVTSVNELQNLPLRVAAPVIQASVVSVLTVVALAIISPMTSAWIWLAVVLLISAVVAVPVTAALGARSARTESTSRATVNEQVSRLVENLDVVSAFGGLEQARAGIAKHEQAQLRATQTTARAAGIGTSLLSLLFTCAVVLAAWAGATGVSAGLLDHRWLAVLALVPLAVYEVVSPTLGATGAWQRYLVEARKVAEIEDTVVPAEIAWGDGHTELTQIHSLELRGAAFAHPGSQNSAISDISLTLKPGDRLLITGPSGSGKTTLAYGLCGLLAPIGGEVLLNGTPLRQFAEAGVRARIGYLEQSPTIFDGTLSANLLIGAPHATDAQLLAVLERTGLAGTFEAREGLDTQLGERGVAVSGGEAQRISLARALLADFQVLVFDEPTASVDESLAEQLWADLASITALDPNRISVFITHQPSAALRASQHLRLT